MLPITLILSMLIFLRLLASFFLLGTSAYRENLLDSAQVVFGDSNLRERNRVLQRDALVRCASRREHVRAGDLSLSRCGKAFAIARNLPKATGRGNRTRPRNSQVRSRRRKARRIRRGEKQFKCLPPLIISLSLPLQIYHSGSRGPEQGQ